MAINISEVAQKVFTAQKTLEPVDYFIRETDTDSVADAFRVQQEVVRLKVNEGDKVVGFKLGNIAKAMQDKFGVDEPDYGYLLASNFRPENLSLNSSEFVEPFIELEPAFHLKSELGGPHVTVADVIAATDYVVPALEIIDSRVKNWEIGLYDTLADCGSVGAVILGSQPRALSEVNLADLPGWITYDGKEVARGNTSAVYGSPLSALAWLCRRISEYGVTIPAGSVVIPGSCLAAEKLIPGTQVTGHFEGWGSVSFDYLS